MGKRTVLQIPMNSNLKTDVETIALEEGFDSIQAFTRFVYTKIANKELSISAVNEPLEYISEEYEEYLNQREKETMDAIKNGTAYTAYSAEELIEQLESDDEED